ncbi:winged helix-turn-helix domain-containing protein [Croceicoccus gelatinilyticus]|uniref:winged helix-turn-helix domain-containing protein n=1 Tax=Croceicoccus gelatinilyticus TaxID=2835536 RepID=UPI001BCEDDCD|nr:winged helix-turn-helix domain-containing protein [Croceicoccus gelatinilyticus]MBS7671181.1 winged helix-turn-helix domain-containing protein [Croceicoccus gelatinilyticus]
MAATRIDLAHEPDFTAGPFTVLPRTRELVGPEGDRVVLEHRVMQVLIAIARVDGEIVTRDDLIETCWDGRIVGEDALNRVISRLRKALAKVGDGIARIETLHKVGYRLMLEAEPDAAPSSPLTTSRRQVLAASLAAILVGGVGIYAGTRNRAGISPEIMALLAQSRQLLGQETRDAQNQAIGLLKNVVGQAPAFADGWGRLALGYGLVSHTRLRAEAEVMRSRALAAAREALEIDQNNACAEIAVSVSLPCIGSYMERDQCQQRALKAEARNYDAIVCTANTLQFVGRNAEAVDLYRSLPDGPVTPADRNNMIRALWSAGLAEETDRELVRATSLYPTQISIWLTRLYIKLFSGDVGAAVALAHDTRNAPTGTFPDRVARFELLASALETRQEGQVDAATSMLRERAKICVYEAELSMRGLCALNRVDEAFVVADAYYFNEGYSIPDFTPDGGVSIKWRNTRQLFEPVTAPMRADRRFERLVARLGLAEYWDAAGSQPDYRRA